MRIAPFLEDFAVRRQGVPVLSAQFVRVPIYIRGALRTDTPYLDEVNASTGKTVEREYEQHRAKGGSGVSFALGPRHGPALAAGADQPFDG